jgi:hypothetical protein
MPRKKNPDLTVEQDRFVRMEANGMTSPEIILELWGMKKEDDPKEYHNLECKLSRWRDHPRYEEVWKEEVRKQDFQDYIIARKVLRKSMKQEKDGWLAMQSAVNAMNNSSKRIYQGEDSAVTVKIEGLPDLGTPDGE